MIELHYNQGGVLVYDPDGKNLTKVEVMSRKFLYFFLDWAILRKTHRILGTLIGNTNIIQCKYAK